MRSGVPTAEQPAILIRPSTASDIDAITAIYTDAVLHGTGTFELDPPDVAEMARRRVDVIAKRQPWLVALARQPVSANGGAPGANGSSNVRAVSSEATDDEGQVLGYAYATPFRPRSAYRHTLESSVYVRAEARGRHIGRLLMTELMARAEALGARQMTAIIGDADNLACIALHHALGFAPVGTLRHVGRKFDRWLDVVLMQRALGPGSSTAPTCTQKHAQTAPPPSLRKP